MAADSTPLHPLVSELLDQRVTPDGSHVGFSARALASCRAKLLTELRDDKTAFLHILVAWARFHDEQLEPASTQLYELVRLLPQVQNAKSKEALLARARTAAHIAGGDALSRISAGLAAPQGGAAMGRRR